jgi:hypothetical protein
VRPGNVQDLLAEAAERGEKLTELSPEHEFAPETCIIVGLAEMIRDLRAGAIWDREFEKGRARHRSMEIVVDEDPKEAA